MAGPKNNSWPPGEASGGRWIELDFLRGVAVLMVVFGHMHFPAHTSVGPVIWFDKAYGAFGVDLFFVLSGFLIGGLLFQDVLRTGKVDIGRFYIRRALKILPPLYTVLLFHLLSHRHPASSFLWQNLLMVPNYFGTSIAQTWTLGVEEHFYLGLAALMVVFTALKARLRTMIAVLALIALAAAAGRCAAVAFGQIDIAVMHTQFRIDTLIAGVILAALYWLDRPRFEALQKKRRLLVTVAVVSMTGMAVCFLNTPVMRTLGFELLALGWSCVLLLTFKPGEQPRHGLFFRLMARVGVYSYGIYLWHSLMQAPAEMLMARFAALGVDPNVTVVAVTLLQLAVALGTGVAATHLVEWPVLKFREIFFPRVRRSEAGAASAQIEGVAQNPAVGA
jgi:peptidoglycan/LPS O-acetylase OafA/YrhL